MEDLPDINISKLSANHITTRFKTGDVAFAPLKTFIQNHAGDFQKAMVAQTYVATENGISEDGRDKKNDVVGYITLTCSEIDLENGYQIADCQYANRYPTMPALKIARLAVDCRHRNKGIGELLVGMALAIAQDEIAPSAGCRFVVTDAKQDAVGFYERQGFTRIDSEANQQREQPVMFVDLQINDDE